MTDNNNGTIRTLNEGEFLMKEGDPGDHAYIIEQGSVEILITRENQLIQIGTRGKGALMGEMAIIDDQPRTASVRALENCKILVITKDDLTRRIDSADPIMRMVTQVVLARYRDMLSRTHVMSMMTPAQPTNVEELETNEDIRNEAMTTLKVHNELKNAIDNDHLKLFYQPIIDLSTNKIAGFEALARWIHPEKGMISPGIFIPVAEESGLIVEISKWALETACKATKDLMAVATDANSAGKDDLFVGVNFSVQDFSDAHFFEDVKKTLKDNDVDPKQIHIEITESLLMEQPEMAKDALEKCNDIGIDVSIDDFGTGYSSLSYLHFFPISTLKIDQSFIRSMLEHENTYQLVKSIVSLAQNLKMSVIAEGIEHREEAAVLKALNCEQCQGFWYGKPQPLEDTIETLKNWTPPSLDPKDYAEVEKKKVAKSS